MEDNGFALLRSEIKGAKELLLEKIQGIHDDNKRVEKDVALMRESQQKQFVTQADFKPVRLIVYGMVALMLSTLILAIVATVLGKVGK